MKIHYQLPKINNLVAYKNFLRSTRPDSDNGDAFDICIEGLVQNLLHDLQLQRIDYNIKNCNKKTKLHTKQRILAIHQKYLCDHIEVKRDETI